MNSIPHLTPCMNSVAIGAQQAKVAFVGFPVFEAVKPVTGTFPLFELLFPINVVNVKNAMVVNSTFNAFPSEGGNQSKLFLPVFWVLVGCKAVFVPVVSSARVAAKPVFTLFAAIFARLFFPPSMGQVASLAAKLAGAIFKPVSVNLELFRAVFTALCHLCFLAHLYLLNTFAHYKPKYFDIACRRIEQAAKQGQLFEPTQAAPVQLGLEAA